jgi:hypothetical protein
MSLFPEFNSCRQNSYLPLHKKEKKENPTTKHKRPKDSVKELLDKSNLPRKKKKKPNNNKNYPRILSRAA